MLSELYMFASTAMTFPLLISISAIVLSFLPPLIWLMFYLREDTHPEPKHLIVYTFLFGVLAAGFAYIGQLLAFGQPLEFRGVPFFPGGILFYAAPQALQTTADVVAGKSLDQFTLWAVAGVVLVLFGAACIEEYVKYRAVKYAALSRPEFDEPVDAMIYMITAALGFAAIENVLYLTQAFQENFQFGYALTINRFVGANLLHALSSAIVGYAIARHFFTPWRKHAIALGVVSASILHTLFNYFTIVRRVESEYLFYIVLLLGVMTVAVLIDFHRLKRSVAVSPSKEGADPPSPPPPPQNV